MAEGAERSSGVVVRCACGLRFDLDAFSRLTFVGFTSTAGDTGLHEVRMCTCGRTIDGGMVVDDESESA